MTRRSRNDERQLAFQLVLDDRFPVGGLCATFFEQAGRLRPTGVELVSGRLVCVAASQARDGQWWYQVVIDPRRKTDEQVTQLALWIGAFEPHDIAPNLWEAPIKSSSQVERLRVHADPEPPWRPTRAMRKAVTEAHGAEIPVSASSSTGQS